MRGRRGQWLEKEGENRTFSTSSSSSSDEKVVGGARRSGQYFTIQHQPPLTTPSASTPRATIIRAVSFSWCGQWRRKRGNESNPTEWDREYRKVWLGVEKGENSREGCAERSMKTPPDLSVSSLIADDVGCTRMNFSFATSLSNTSK